MFYIFHFISGKLMTFRVKDRSFGRSDMRKTRHFIVSPGNLVGGTKIEEREKEKETLKAPKVSLIK